MITKLRKAQDSWIAKAIFALTALSFMSLFGISGYLSRAAENPAVIRVNNQKISLAEFNAQVDEQVKMLRKLFGEEVEISDEMRDSIAHELVQKNLTDLIIKETARDKNIHISNELIRSIIVSQPQFLDENGRFNRAAFNNFLSVSGWSEGKYVEALRADLIKSMLIGNPTSGFDISKTLLDLASKAAGQRKIFKYVVVDPAEIKVDRQISDEEIEQYYSDFAEELIEPEIRDISVLELSFDDIAARIEISDDEIEEYYKSNIDSFVTPETREVLQMLFTDKDKAEEAKKELEDGKDFYEVALSLAEQSKEDTYMGYVAKDSLLSEFADDVFSAGKGEVVGPLESDLGEHIFKVVDIKEGSKVDDAKARKQIVEVLQSERAYEDAYDSVKAIDDEIGGGQTLEDVAAKRKLQIKKITNLRDTINSPYTETAFLYNLDEVSQAVETDNGFIFVRVDKITDAHPLEVEEAAPQIKKMWEENERSAIAQEMVNDIVSDLENGDTIDEAAKRRGLTAEMTEPLTRAQSFAELKPGQIRELFNEEEGTPKQFNIANRSVIAIVSGQPQIKDLTAEEMDMLKRRLQMDIDQEAMTQLLNSYGKDYDVRVKYRQLGLED
ncbi:MAG: SurA N-terminal domain-containing protein [Alphaproteobacteria bacterium]|nr:SurA N-terminal domain-containing protein [Alphaproteobacteria bacterium]